MEEQSGIDYSRLFKVRKTIFKMMEDRGYVVDEKEKNLSYENFKSKENIDFSYIFDKKKKDPTEPKKQLLVKFYPEESVSVETIKNMCNIIDDQKLECGIMIGRTPLKALAKKIFEEFTQALNVQYFVDKELVVNITEHELVPKHILLDKEEKEQLLRKYKLKESQLPKILTTDPVARYLGVRRRDVVKIIRASETAGRYVTYRIAV